MNKMFFRASPLPLNTIINIHVAQENSPFTLIKFYIYIYTYQRRMNSWTSRASAPELSQEKQEIYIENEGSASSADGVVQRSLLKGSPNFKTVVEK